MTTTLSPPLRLRIVNFGIAARYFPTDQLQLGAIVETGDPQVALDLLRNWDAVLVDRNDRERLKRASGACATRGWT